MNKSKVTSPSIEEVQGLIEKKIWRKVTLVFATLTFIFSTVFGVSFWQAYKKCVSYINKSIAEKFAEPNIQKTLRDVATEKASKIIAEQVEPSIKEMKTEIGVRTTKFNEDLDSLQNKYSKDYSELNREIENLKKRNEIVRLSDDVIAFGDRDKFDRLVAIAKTPDADLRSVAISEVIRIKSVYGMGTRLKAYDITATSLLGARYKNEEISTDILCKDLKRHKNWRVRGKSAEILGNRKERSSLIALLYSIKTDTNLDVFKTSIQSFSQLTGFQPTDTLNADQLLIWWRANKKEIVKDFPA